MNAIERVFAGQQASRARLAATTADERIEKIRRLERAILDGRDEIRAAMFADFRKSAQEVDLTEIYAIVSEARQARRHLRKWMKPRRVPTPLSLLGSRSRIVCEPKGTVLIISPWNFPFNLTFGPLISAVAAGNTAMVKPSEMTPHSSACIGRIVARVFPENEVAVVEGGPDVGAELLQMAFDHIFFTGSPSVGRLVMKAAAEHLTSVTLELGGKSPAIVERSADVEVAARRVVWGKFINAGQICIAPDYVLVDAAIHDDFVAAVKRAAERIPALERTVMVNDRHAERVNGLIAAAVSAGAKLVTGGPFTGRDAAPTVITGVPAGAAVMEEEIFGPVLPIVAYRTIDEALAMIAARAKPLAMYIFARSRKSVNTILARTSAGGTAINHTMIHFYQLNLPFGGVGQSGMGRGHGFYGFEAFSNTRGVLEQWMPISPIEWLVPPYSRLKDRVIDFLVRYL